MKYFKSYRPLTLVAFAFMAQLLAYGTTESFPDQFDEVNELVNNHFYKAAILKADSILTESNLEPEERGAILLLKGKTLYAHQKPVQAIGCYNQTLALDLPHMSLVRANAFSALGELYDGEKSFDLARSNYQAAFKIYKKIDHIEGQADIYSKMGLLEKREKNHQAALKNLKSAHSLYSSVGNDLQRAYTAESIGLIQYRLGEYDDAEFYLLDAIMVYDSTDFHISQDYLIQYLTAIYNMNEEYGSAILYTQKAIEASSLINDSAKVSLNYRQLAFFQNHNEELREAVKSQKRALAWTPGAATSQKADFLLHLAKLYASANRDADAIVTFYDAYKKAEEGNDLDKMIASSRATSDYFLSRQNAEEAMRYATRTDSLNQKKISLLSSNYRELFTSHKADLNSEGNSTPKEAVGFWTKNTSLLSNVLIGILAVLMIAVLYMFRRSSQNRRLSKVLEWKVYKRTRDLQKANKELNTYIYKSSHDLRTPLTSIKSLLRLLSTEQHSQTSNKYLGLIESCTEQMDDILIKLSRAVDYKNVDIKVAEIDFSRLQFELEQKEIDDLKGVKLIWDIDQDAPFFSDINLIKVILKKTIDNSIDYRLGAPDDYCKVSIATNRNGATLTIEDNGVGIAEKVKDTVFDMFVKGTHRSKGAGLGLYLVKIATERVQGKIQLVSEEKKGSKITFTLPNLT